MINISASIAYCKVGTDTVQLNFLAVALGNYWYVSHFKDDVDKLFKSSL